MPDDGGGRVCARAATVRSFVRPFAGTTIKKKETNRVSNAFASEKEGKGETYRGKRDERRQEKERKRREREREGSNQS